MSSSRFGTAMSCLQRPSVAVARAAVTPRLARGLLPASAFGKPRKSQKRVQTQLPPANLDTSTRLKILFSRPSTSTSPAQIDETTLLTIVRPVFELNRSLLDPFLHDIAISLSPEKTLPTTRDPETEQVINDILAHCWLRSNELKSDRFTSVQLTDLARRYVRRLVRLTLDGSDAHELLDHLESNLKLYKVKNFLLPPSLFAAWAMLRHEASAGELPVQFIPTKAEYVLQALNSLLGNQDQEFERYAPAVEALMDANSGAGEEMPPTPEELNTMLGAMRIGQQTREVVNLWKTYRQGLRSDGESGSEKDKSTRLKILASFLRFFSRSSVKRRLPAEERELAIHRDEVLSFIPRPWPAAIHHSLLMHRARVDDDIKSMSEARALDEETTEFRDRDKVRDDLEAAWNLAGQEGARDLKTYMLYMEGLAKVGDARRLGLAWEQLVVDEECKKGYHKDEGEGLPFPPTRALNHMISCSFLVPNEGTSIALELFEQASLPSSSIPIDIVTINTVLRHHARRGVVDAMLSLFPLAEKLKLRPDVVTYTVLLQGLLRARELKMAAMTLETMYKQGIPPNERTISLLISDLSKNGERQGLRTAELLMREMRALHMRVGEVPWTSLISGYFKGGWDADAWVAIRRMEENGVAFNRIGYNMVLRELGERVYPSDPYSRPPTSTVPHYAQNTDGEDSPLLAMFERMIKNVPPNSDTYLIVLTPLVRAHKWEEADRVVKEMKSRGFVAEKVALRAILNRVARRKTRWD